MLTVTDQTFDELVLGNDRPVLLEFWATWCPPCRMLRPVLEQIAVERADSLVVATLDTDANPETTRRAQVLANPTVQIYRAGSLLGSVVGARPKSRLLAEVDAALAIAAR